MPFAVVTGANRGLGLETSRQLLERGYQVLLTARSRADAETAAAGLHRESARAAELDIEKPESVAALARTLTVGPRVDVLVNNAGASFDGFDAGVAERTLDTNYRGALRVTDALAPLLSEQANVVMVSSGMGELSHFGAAIQKRLLEPSLSREALEQIAHDFVAAVRSGQLEASGFPRNAYSVSKALMNGLTRVLSRELAPRRVNAVCPGWVRTRMGGNSAPRSLEVGGRSIVWAATLDASGPSAGFFRDGRRIEW